MRTDKGSNKRTARRQVRGQTRWQAEAQPVGQHEDRQGGKLKDSQEAGMRTD